jgi:hypothetical protein
LRKTVNRPLKNVLLRFCHMKLISSDRFFPVFTVIGLVGVPPFPEIGKTLSVDDDGLPDRNRSNV